jgi:O-antigen ligase/tetratricopeptide (TPR) repeat protein
MTHRTLDISDAAPGNRVDLTIDWLLAGILAFMPLALGVVQPWSETITIAAIAALALCLTLRQTRRDAGVVWTWAYVPMLLFIAVAIIQLVPMPGSWVGAISPQTLSVKSQVLGDAASPSDTLTFSFYPRATRHDLQVVLLAAAVFVTVLHVYRTADQVKRLLTAIAVIGGAAGLLALVQYVSGADKIYWTVPMPPGRRPNGPFVHYSHYAQFMNLSMGAALGLFLVRAKAAHPNRRLSLSRVLRNLTDRDYRFAWWLGGVLIIGIVTICFSMSRGGVISLLVALTLTIASLSRRQGLGGRKWLIGGVVVLASLGLLYLAFDKVSDRLATLYNIPDPTAGRAQIYKDVWQESFPRFPVLGMGLGTFEVTYPMFDRSSISSLATHADADWLQLLHETGAVGLVLVLLFVAVVVFRYFRATRGGRPTICAAAFGLGFGLLAVMVNSFSDYGQHLPAIACLSAVSCALMINLGRWKRPDEAAADEFRAPAPLAARVALPVASLVGLCWVLPQANAARVADQQWDQVQYTASRLEQEDWAGSQEDYASLVSAADDAVRADPGDANHRYWLSVYRWRSIDHPAPATQPSDDEDDTAARAIAAAVPEIDVSKLKMLDETPEAQPTTEPAAAEAPEETPPPPGPTTLPADKYPQARAIVAELMETRRMCPTFGPLYSVAGQIRFFALHEPAGADEVELGYQLTKDHPITSYAAALVDGTRGHWDAARQHFRRCLELQNGKMIPEVVYSCLYRLNRPELALEVVNDRLDWLCVAANCLIDDGRHDRLATDVSAKVVERLKSQGLPADARVPGHTEKLTPGVFATAGVVSQHQKEYALASQYYQQALALDYGNAGYRYQLAECLYAMDRKQEAAHEARICLRFDPSMGGAKRIIADAAAPLVERPESN